MRAHGTAELIGKSAVILELMQEIELARGMGIAVDAEQAAGVEGHLDEGGRRVLAFWP